MATNREFTDGQYLPVIPTDHIGGAADPQSGDPILLGVLPGVALTDADADDEVTADFGGVYRLDVHGHDGATTDTAIDAGDPVFFDGTADELNANSGATLFGHALDDVAAGATTETRVKIAQV